MPDPSTLFLMFTATACVELLAVGVAMRRTAPTLTIVAVVLLVHAITEPLATALYAFFGLPLLGIAVLATFVDGAFYARLFPVTLRYAIATSGVANIAAFLIAALLNAHGS